MNCEYGMTTCFKTCVKRCTPEGAAAVMKGQIISLSQKRGIANSRKQKKRCKRGESPYRNSYISEKSTEVSC